MTLSDDQIRALLRRRADQARRDELDGVLARAMEVATSQGRRRRIPVGRWVGAAVAAVLVVSLVGLAIGPRITLNGGLVPLDGNRPSSDGPASRVDALFAQYRGLSPGCAVAVSQAGQVVYQRGFGLADIETRTPILPTTAFDVAGISAQVTAASILLLAQEGQLSLDDDVHRYIPELPDEGRALPLRTLLNRVSGLPDYVGLLEQAGFGPSRVPSPADGLRVLAAAPLAPGPGVTFGPASSNYFLLGLVVQRVTHESLRQFAAARLFGPLGMDSSVIAAGGDPGGAGAAIPYTVAAAAGGSSYAPKDFTWDVVGAGGLRTTVLDLLKWGANLESRAVPAAAIQPAQLTAGSNDGTGTYAAGWHSWSVLGRQLLFQDGGWPQSGFRSALTVDLADHLAVALECNLTTVTPAMLSFDIVDAWLGPSQRR